MKKEHRDINKHKDLSGLSDEVFSRMDIPWEKSKEQIWNGLDKGLTRENSNTVKTRIMLPRRQWIALAASLTLLIAVTSFMKFYSVKTMTPEGVRTSLYLPDGSSVELNAATTLEYHPYWWFLSRKVELAGEAYFQVKEGKKFLVHSDLGNTEVLGTKFNVFARGVNYQVSCHTGKVKVTGARTGKSVTLSPNEQAQLDKSGGFDVSANQESSPAWTKNLLMFHSAPLNMVFEEIERQYGIVIEAPDDMEQVYSGNFSLDQSVENILSLLCLPFDLEYEHQSNNEYLVYPSAE